ncbi:MAG: N utilization substance protein A [Alteromonas naphthalenivorans]
MSLSDVIEALVDERGLEKEVLNDIVCEGMLSAYEKRYPELHFRVSLNKKTDSLVVESEKNIVSSVEDEDTQISLRKARGLDPKATTEQMLWVPFEGAIGRIEILRAKQVIAQKIRQIESAAVYNEFKSKEGSILQGTIHKAERSGTMVKLQEYLAFLPKSLGIPGEKLPVGYPIRAMLKEVLEVPRNENQLILDRSSDVFVEALFGLEIPEVFEKLVEIRKIVRIPGYKTKVAVSSNDSNIDPVGTCVGVGGVRIKPILKELGNEKVDIVSWTSDIETLVRSSLKPAEINRVELSDDGSFAQVWLDDDQRSLAIGKMGQNIALGAQLTGVKIELVQSDTKDLEQRLSEEL